VNISDLTPLLEAKVVEPVKFKAMKAVREGKIKR
jgi:hypothetical protein